MRTFLVLVLARDGVASEDELDLQLGTVIAVQSHVPGVLVGDVAQRIVAALRRCWSLPQRAAATYRWTVETPAARRWMWN